MPIYEHIETFAGLPVREYDPARGIEDPAGAAYRLGIEYDQSQEGDAMVALIGRFVEDPAARQVVALVIGSWETWSEKNEGADRVVAALAGAADRLPALLALFFGEITSEECEISWIQQSDVGPLIAAFPKLEELTVRGGSGLQIKKLKRSTLRRLTIEAGGLPKEVVKAVGAAEWPELEHLELWLGDEGYGGDATVKDLKPILAGDRFPKLKSLALRNCAFADELAVALAEAPILRRIEALDLSLGTLGDHGALALVTSGVLGGLRSLDIHHHYVSDEILDGLKATGVDLNAEDRQEPDEDDGVDHRYVAVSE